MAVPILNVQELFERKFERKDELLLIDVRRPEEFLGELGHIDGSLLYTMGPALQTYLEAQDRDQSIAFICRSGARSERVTVFAQQLGFKNVFNLQGGMLAWNSAGLPVKRC